MKKFFVTIATVFSICFFGINANAAESNYKIEKAPINTKDMKALQNGARLFSSNCMGCHGAEYVRYSKLRDIGFTDKELKEKFMWSTDKIGDTMKNNVPKKQAKELFGAYPPDLSLIARSKSTMGGASGADYVYAYLRTYYRDEERPSGWNNLAYPNTAMPNPFWEQQGERKPLFDVTTVDGKEVSTFKGWEEVKAGTQTQEQFDKDMADISSFLQWIGEPVADNRVKIGLGVMFFLAIFTFVAWRLNAAYWKSIK